MHLIDNNPVEKREGATFSGPATLTSLLKAQRDGGMSITLVSFENGSVTNWHEHPGEQILYVLEGRCRTGDGEQSWELGPGEMFYVGPGEKHWHGAVEGQSMTHLSFTTVGSPTWYDHAP